MTDPVVRAMETGAGLPVLAPLDRLLETRAMEDTQTPPEREAVRAVLDASDAWLDALDGRTLERLDACDEGPLKDRMLDHLEALLAPARERVSELKASLEHEVPWEDVIELLDDLQGLRDEVAYVQQAATYMAETARLVGDVPDDEEGQRALDDLSALEAKAASLPDPRAWTDHARRIEQRALEAVRIEPEPASKPPSQEDGADQTSNGSEALAPPDGAVDTGKTVSGTGISTNGRPNGPRPVTQKQKARDRQRAEASAPRRPDRRPRTGHEKPAGPDVLAEWEATPTDPSLRHGPFWAPILQGELVPAEHDVEELAAYAGKVEVDLVDIELPRVLAVPTGGGARTVRRRIAERAEAITKDDPERPAREAFLDYVVGKLPRRYRETSRGLTLVESVAHAICTDDAWEQGGPDYEGTVRRMVAAELDRTPAIDLDRLAEGLVGSDPEARRVVEQAARRIAEDDPRVTFHEKGILVRALAAREDPDALYDLKVSLKRRLPPDRADELVSTLITTGEDEP